MISSGIRDKACIGVLCVICLLPAGRLLAQAPPGPLPPSHPLPPPPPTPKPKKKAQAEPRKSLAGFWKLNTEESDDPKQRFDDRRKTQVGQGGGNSGGGMGGPRIGGYPPYPGGPGGGPNGPGGGPNGPYGGGGREQGGDEDYDRMQDVVRPAYSQDITLKDAEVDSADEHSNKLVFYTDGRKIQKSKDDSLQEVSAHWNGMQLVTDEKGPRNRKINRTLELSSDGRQMTETWRIESRHSDTPITIRYVYDAAEQYE